MDHSGFQTSSATVHASNIGDDKYILQVTPLTVSLMEGGAWLRPVVKTMRLVFLPLHKSVQLEQCQRMPRVTPTSVEQAATVFLCHKTFSHPMPLVDDEGEVLFRTCQY